MGTHQEKRGLEWKIKSGGRKGWQKWESKREEQTVPQSRISHPRLHLLPLLNQLSWPHLLPRVYFPGSLFPGPEEAVGMPGPWFSAGGYSTSSATGAARPCSGHLWETQATLTEAFCLRLGKTVLIFHNCPRNDNEQMAPCHLLFCSEFASMQTSCPMTWGMKTNWFLQVCTQYCHFLTALIPAAHPCTPSSPAVSLSLPQKQP